MRFGTIAIAALAVTLSAFGADQNVGTWKINMEKSKLQNPAAWKGRRMIIESTDNGIRITFEQPMPDGQIQKRVSVRSLDGKENPVEGSPGHTTTSQRIDYFHIRTTFKTNGKETSALDGTISPDGKTMTNIVKGTDSHGKPFEEIRVFDRQ